MIQSTEREFDVDSILSCRLPNFKQWIDQILREVESAKVDFQYTHQIGGRWENAYLPVESVPCLLYTSPSPRDVEESRMPSSA